MTDETTPQDAGAMPPASAGSVAGRVALFDSQQQALFRQWITSPAAGYVRQNLDGTPYHHPQPTLTDAEREAVERAIEALLGVEDVSAGACAKDDAAAATLHGLLERTQPDHNTINHHK